MKKSIFILIGFMFLMSCKSKQHYTKRTHTNTRHVVDRAKETKTSNKTTKISKTQTPKPQNQVIVSPNTVYNDQFITNLYYGKNLDKVKIDYIKKFSKLAINEMEAYKIPASITLAQGLLESRYGQSELTKKSKNHFGIKCHKWTGKRVYHDDDAKGECFRKYDYDANSYRDHSLFLANKKRYAKLFTFAQNDYNSWAKGLRKAGYATDSRYPKKLINLIETYELYVFDNMVLGENYVPKVDKKTIHSQVPSVHIVEVGETLYSISGKYFVAVKDIKYFNNLKSNTINVGQKLKLTGGKQPEKITYQTHIVQKGDTLYSLSKKYHITVEKLKTLNNLINNDLSLGQTLIIE